MKIPKITKLLNRRKSISDKASIDKELLNSESELRKIKRKYQVSIFVERTTDIPM